MTPIDFDVVVPKLDAILARGLSTGIGTRTGQMCIEAAVCAALDLPHGDDPQCVSSAVRRFKIRLNDSRWSSPEARAAGLRNLGIAQLGSKGVIDDQAFATKLAEGTIRRLIPALFRQVFSTDVVCLAAADRCEREGTRDAVVAAKSLAYSRYDAGAAAAYAYAYAAAAATYAAYAAAAAAYAYAADAYAAATYAAYAAAAAAYAYAADAYAADADADARFNRDIYLCLSASIALDVLRELRSPGALWLDAHVSSISQD